MNLVLRAVRMLLPVRLLVWPGVLFLLLVPGLLAAQPVTELTLQDVLSTTLDHAANTGEAAGSSPYQASSWLAGLPSLSLSYLGSEDRYGVDESELNVNLPVKSARRRSADSALQTAATGLDEAAQRQRALYYSGLIREAVWSYQLAQTQRQSAAQKHQLLLELQQRQQALLAAATASEYTLLLVQTELVQVEIAQQDTLQESRRWLERYQALTGLSTLPADTREAVPPLQDFRVDQHPQVQVLELAHQQRLQLLRASSAQAADWNVALKAKNLDSDGYNEQQYGLGVEIPLSVFSVASQSDNSEWRTAQRDYLLARDQLHTGLNTSWQQLLNERDSLERKKTLLARAQTLSGQIAEQLAQLGDSNEIAQEIVLRRTMEAVDTRAELALNQLLLDQNTAMLRQAAGISL